MLPWLSKVYFSPEVFLSKNKSDQDNNLDCTFSSSNEKRQKGTLVLLKKSNVLYS